jgi:hypothetical protein
MVYALLDSAVLINRKHLRVALAVWRYREAPPGTFLATLSVIRLQILSFGVSAKAEKSLREQSPRNLKPESHCK